MVSLFNCAYQKKVADFLNIHLSWYWFKKNGYFHGDYDLQNCPSALGSKHDVDPTDSSGLEDRFPQVLGPVSDPRCGPWEPS